MAIADVQVEGMERQIGPVWHFSDRHGCTLGIGATYWNDDSPALLFNAFERWLFFYPPRQPGEGNSREARLSPPSPTLILLLTDLPLSGCWPAVVDRLIEEYPETEPHIVAALNRVTADLEAMA